MTLDSEILNQAIKLTTLGMGIVFGLLIVLTSVVYAIGLINKIESQKNKKNEIKKNYAIAAFAAVSAIKTRQSQEK
tara:strand:+ start:8022 stop:8249 length:228 start_codon:yes stop_codon:yes gene_type:complete